MFEGSFTNAVDDKGRVAIPARHRDVLKTSGEEHVMVTYHYVPPDHCLDIYTPLGWQQLKQRLKNNPRSFGKARTLFESVYIGQAQACQLDRQGRILIPQGLRDLAELGQEVTFVGTGERVRVFAADVYAKSIIGGYQQMMRDDPDALGDFEI